MNDLEKKLAVVSGGTGGVGLEVAQRLAARGAHVVVTGRSQENGERALSAIEGEATFEAVDSADHAAFSEMITRVASAYDGGVDFVVSAGTPHDIGPTPFAEMSPEDLKNAFESRLYPRIFPVHAAIPALRRRGGSVVMLTTDAARHATSGESVMGAAGAAVILMTKTLAREFSRWDVRVNSVSMTITSDTPSWDRIFGSESFQSKLFTKAVERFPQGRPPTAGEVADVATFLAADATQVTGQTVSVNGGLSFGGW
ncbi:MAG: putative oxidoreductase [Marmoricola sp.]|nr:putative oxidoreductase [Marmoricola sp.]